MFRWGRLPFVHRFKVLGGTPLHKGWENQDYGCGPRIMPCGWRGAVDYPSNLEGAPAQLMLSYICVLVKGCSMSLIFLKQMCRCQILMVQAQFLIKSCHQNCRSCWKSVSAAAALPGWDIVHAPLTEVWKQCMGSCNFCLSVKGAWFCFFDIFTFPTVERKFPTSPCVTTSGMGHPWSS